MFLLSGKVRRARLSNAKEHVHSLEWQPFHEGSQIKWLPFVVCRSVSITRGRWEGEANVRSGLQQPKERSRRPQRGAHSHVVRNVLKIAIFQQLGAAIGHYCRVLTRKKSGQPTSRLAYESKETTGTTFLQGWWSQCDLPELLQMSAKTLEDHSGSQD